MAMQLDFSKIQLIDLTYALNETIPHFTGECGFQNHLKIDYPKEDNQTRFRINKLELYAGAGTHMDAPMHCFPGATSIADLTLERLIVPCVVIDIPKNAPEDYCVSPEDILNFEKQNQKIPSGVFVMIRTGWGKYWYNSTKFRNDLVFPTISAAATQLLIDRNIAGLGVDTLSPDNPTQGFPVHRLILGNGKYLIENIANAESLPTIGAYICALPLKIENGTEAPIRLIALVEKQLKI